MKLSIAISALILAGAAGLVWQIDGRLAVARTNERKLASEAAKLGISISDDHATRSANRVRVDGGTEARLLAAEYIQLTKLSEKGGKLDEASQTRYQNCIVRISALSTSNLKTLIADVLSNPELEKKRRIQQVTYLLSTVLARRDPRAALKFIKEHSAALKDADGVENVISNALGTWAKDDPAAAVEWMKKNAAEFPEAMKAQSQANVFRAAAEKDPRLAFTLIAVLGLNYSDSHSALHDIVTAAATDEQRNVTLAALREYRDANKKNRELARAADDMVGYFSGGFKEVGFQAGSKWLASAKLNPEELDRFCGELTRNYNGDEHAQWIKWIGENFPPGKGDGQIMDLIRRWTSDDYEAAGKWLGAAPEGPVKNAAIRSYAQTIFPQEPEVAMQWIKTLPPGEQRQNTLQYIHENYLQNDPEAAAAFKAGYGLK